MKACLLALAGVLALAPLAVADTVDPTDYPLYDAFEDGTLPAGWSVIVNNGYGPAFVDGSAQRADLPNWYWGIGVTDQNTGLPVYGDPLFDGDYLVLDADDPGANMDVEIYTHSFQVYGDSVFTFVMDYKEHNDVQESLKVDISTDGGSSWTNLVTFDEDYWDTKRNTEVSMDLSGYAGETAALRFHYRSGDYQHPTGGDPVYGWWFALDTVAVTPEPASLGLLAIGGIALLRRRRR